jgi:hypothetical protein
MPRYHQGSRIFLVHSSAMGPATAGTQIREPQGRKHGSGLDYLLRRTDVDQKDPDAD